MCEREMGVEHYNTGVIHDVISKKVQWYLEFHKHMKHCRIRNNDYVTYKWQFYFNCFILKKMFVEWLWVNGMCSFFFLIIFFWVCHEIWTSEYTCTLYFFHEKCVWLILIIFITQNSQRNYRYFLERGYFVLGDGLDQCIQTA